MLNIASKGDRMAKFNVGKLDRVSAGGAQSLTMTLDYSCATLQFAGLVLYGYLRRGGGVLLRPIERAVLPIFEKVKGLYRGSAKRFLYKELSDMSKRLDTIERRLYRLEDSAALKEALEKIEERLQYLERHGIVAAKDGGLEVKGKKLTEDKLMLLRIIVSENIDLLKEEDENKTA